MTPQPETLEARAGARLLAMRDKRKLTQPEVAVGGGFSLRAYCDWEAGKRLPSGRNLNKLADFFKTTPAALLR